MDKPYTNSAMEYFINEYIHNERNRHILKDRLINGYSYSELGERYYLSERQLKKIVKAAKELFHNTTS